MWLMPASSPRSFSVALRGFRAARASARESHRMRRVFFGGIVQTFCEIRVMDSERVCGLKRPRGTFFRGTGKFTRMSSGTVEPINFSSGGRSSSILRRSVSSKNQNMRQGSFQSRHSYRIRSATIRAYIKSFVPVHSVGKSSSWGTHRIVVILMLLGLVSCSRVDRSAGSMTQRPNVVIILTDDQGYADVGVYGADGFETPHLDGLAREGMRFTSFYVPASICTPSRAALLTGRYPLRVGLPSVLFPRERQGLNPDEVTLAEVLRDQGYATAAFGKWHLGAHPKFLPLNHGFDRFLGLPYSNDMSPDPQNNPREGVRDRFPLLPLIEDTTVVEREPDQATLTRRFTEQAVDFIDENREQPFFLYVAHPFPHVPLYASDRFRGSTEHGLYGDVIREIDWSVGQIVQALEDRGLRDRTLIIFTSDNGPWLVFGDHGGSAGVLREGKITTFEGGHRVPAIASWPDRIPTGRVSDAVVTSMDLFPTIARFAGAQLPDDRFIDGQDIGPLLTSRTGGENLYHERPIYFYLDERLQAVRSGSWKLHVPHDYLAPAVPGSGGDVGTEEIRHIDLSLYNLERDPAETQNVADDHPAVVEQLMTYIEQARADLGDSETGVEGANRGSPGRIDAVWDQLEETD